MKTIKQKYTLKDFGVKRYEKTLKNGLKVVFIEKPYSPIYAKIMMRAGSIYNGSDSGLAHFTEHSIVSGSKKYPKKEEFAGIIESIGGFKNAFTSRTWMSVDCEIAAPEQLKSMKEYLSEALTHMHLDSVKLKKEKGVITSEIEKNHSDPKYHSRVYFDSILANGTSWGITTLGTVESVDTITIKDVEKFFSEYCVVENMVLLIVGGCKFSDIEKTFSSIKFLHGKQAQLPESPKYLSNNQRVFFKQDLKQTNVALIFNGPEVGTKDGDILRFVLNYAHSGFTSRFYKKIRNEKGLAYSVGMFLSDFNKTRYLGTSVGVPAEKTDEVIDAILECYKELLHEGMTQKQINEKIKTSWFSDKRNTQKSSDWINVISPELYPELKSFVGDYPNWFNFSQTITPKEVSIVLKKYITLDNFHLLINGTEPSKKYF